MPATPRPSIRGAAIMARKRLRKLAYNGVDDWEALALSSLRDIAPLGWEHIAFNGDYVWPTEPLENAFRPLRNPRAACFETA
jgi:hypothetical protein